MAADLAGIEILRVLAMPDTRPGQEGQVVRGVMFTVDGQGPFGVELPAGAVHPGKVLAALRARAQEIRAVLLF